MHCHGSRWPDPGPCPVDDKPHTTCTSPDYNPTRYGGGVIVAPIAQPQIVVVPGAPVPAAPEAPAQKVETSTYRGRRPRRPR